MNVVLVAGGATGIGAAVVRAVRAGGGTVLLADVNVDDGERLVADAANGEAAFLPLDFADPSAPRRAVDAALELGRGELDAVFYNAALLEARTLKDWTVEQWDASSAVNLRAPFLFAQAAAPHLARSAHGRLVVTSSTGALRGHAGMPAYHATKAGLLGLVRALADELGPGGVTVNALCPGWVDTQFNDGFWGHQSDPDATLRRLVDGIPLRRQGLADDVVGAVMFLLSPGADYVTGQSLVVDGGYTAV